MRVEIAELAGADAGSRNARAGRRGTGRAAREAARGRAPARHRHAAARFRRQRPAMLEIRAGTGGDEAALFAADLFRMYERYAAEQGWKVEPVSMNANELGGFKEMVANVSGTGRVRQAQVRERGPPGPARAGDRERRAHPHLGGDRRGAARAERGRCPDRGQGPARSTSTAPAAPAASTSTPPIARCASPTCRPASWWRCQDERSQHKNTRQGDAGAARAALREDAQRGPGRRGRGAQGDGRLGRPLRTHPHLQFPARPGDRPPHRPDPAQARPKCSPGRAWAN